jgi:membrane protein DedA with SNARE-associated domain
LPRAERLFAKHGGKTVFFGRFVAVLRITAAWMAGISHMTWWRFLLYNAAGGILWATLIGLVAYYLGGAAADAIQTYGLYAAGGIVVATVGVVFVIRWWERRMLANEE